MNARALITAVFALFTIGCVEFFEVPTTPESCWEEYEGWSTWCEDALIHLQKCDVQIADVESYCDDVYSNLDYCEDDHGVGAWQCDTYADQIPNCQGQWDAANADRLDTLSQISHACGNADELEQTCLAL
jgi:hypothetical protein